MFDIHFFLGLAPLVALIVLIVGLKLPVWKAVLATLVLVLGITYWGFDVSAQTLGMSVAYGALKGFWPITIVIFGAIYSYNIMIKTGAIATIRGLLSSVTDDQRLLILLISWCFGGFLEAAAGFATAVAIPLGILMVLGFKPIRAAVATLVADTVSTTFGAVGIPLVIMSDQLGLPATGFTGLSSLAIMQLGIMDFVIPFVMVVIVGGSLKALKGVVGITLMTGLATFIPQWIIAIYLGPELTAFGGALVSLGVFLWLVKRRQHLVTPEEYRVTVPVQTEKRTTGEILRATSIYALIFLFILASSPLFPSVQHALGAYATTIPFDLGTGKVLTAKLSWIATPGVLILLATVIGGVLFQKVALKTFVVTIFETIKQLWAAGLAISVIVAMATIMDVSGLISTVAEPLLAFTGQNYPFVVPWIGALGTFITGSVTNANILFGSLQVHAAHALSMDPLWLAAGSAAGATAAKMISPQSITIAVSSAGLLGMDATLMKGTLKWALFYLAILTLTVGLGATYFHVS